MNNGHVCIQQSSRVGLVVWVGTVWPNLDSNTGDKDVSSNLTWEERREEVFNEAGNQLRIILTPKHVQTLGLEGDGPFYLFLFFSCLLFFFFWKGDLMKKKAMIARKQENKHEPKWTPRLNAKQKPNGTTTRNNSHILFHWISIVVIGWNESRP